MAQLLWTFTAFFIIVLTAVPGTNGEELNSEVKGSSNNPLDDFRAVDTNADGVISPEEASIAGLSEEVFRTVDTNGDGLIDKDEWQAADQILPGVGIKTQFEPGHPWASIRGKEFAVLLSAPLILYACFSRNLGRFAIICCWLVSSFGMNVMNKLAASHFESTCLLVIIQMVFADLVMILEYKNMTFEKWEDIIKWMIVPFFFAGMLSTSIWAFKETTMSTVLILRNVLPLLAFVVEKQLFNNPPSVSVSLVLSMIVALMGTVAYGYYNISVTAFSACIILVNCLITVADRVLQRYFLASKEFTVSVPLCMAINNTVGIFPMIMIAVLLGEIPKWSNTVAMSSPRTWVWVTMSALFGTCLGYLGLKCQKLVSATTFLMLQNFNKIALIAFGMLSMGDQIHGIPMAGCIVSMLGSIWYGIVRLPAERDDHDKTLNSGKAKAEPLVASSKGASDYGTQATAKKEAV